MVHSQMLCCAAVEQLQARRRAQQAKLADLQASVRRAKRLERIVTRCHARHVELLVLGSWRRWVRWARGKRTAAQQRWWAASAPEMQDAVVGTISAERLRVVSTATAFGSAVCCPIMTTL